MISDFYSKALPYAQIASVVGSRALIEMDDAYS